MRAPWETPRRVSFRAAQMTWFLSSSTMSGDRSQAQALYKTGRQLYGEKQYAEALSNFDRVSCPSPEPQHCRAIESAFGVVVVVVVATSGVPTDDLIRYSYLTLLFILSLSLSAFLCQQLSC